MPPIRFSASYAAQFMACPGSANLELSIPGWVPPVRDETAGRKSEGTFMHDLLAQSASLKAKDMLHLAEAMAYVATLRRKRRFRMLVEETMVAEWLPSKPQTTVDVILHTRDELHVIDYKTGTIPVDAVDNAQALFYAATAAHLAPKAKFVTLHIVQPWAKTGSTVWEVTVQELNQFMTDAIATDLKITAGDTTLTPSDHCTFCPANPHSRGDKGSPLCPAMMQKHYPLAFDEDDILNL